MTDAERRGSVVPRSVPHCRICGYTPRLPKPGESDFSIEKIIEHMECKHPMQVLGFMAESSIAYAQTQGDDSRCEFHGNGGAG